jgi:hypothetical protein
MKLIGVDFTSAPSRRKPITLAVLQVDEAIESAVDPVAIDRVTPAEIAASAGSVAVAGPSTGLHCRLERLERIDSFEAFDAWLQAPATWVAAFDFPFGLPRAFVEGLGWPTSGGAVWPTLTERLQALARPELVAHCRAWCDARPAGNKFAHRATDATAGSSSSMKWVNPPVVLMLHESADVIITETAVVQANSIILVVGPEGGISDPEIAALTGAGAVTVRLGPTVLRTSTAAAVALGALGVLTPRWLIG